MPDMLVKLYTLPPLTPFLERLDEKGITIRRAMAYEREPATAWVRAEFGSGWAGECAAAFSRQPVMCHLAVSNGEILGFACAEATGKGFFGPMGVAEAARGKGVGCALLVAGLHAMRESGYAYAAIGGVGPAEFYQDVVGATLIPDSDPGIYPPRLNEPEG